MTAATVKKQTAANNPVLARIKKALSPESYPQCADIYNSQGEERAVKWAVRDLLFIGSAKANFTVYFSTGRIGEGSISAETAATWEIDA